MRILLDACIWGGAKEILEKSGHDVVWCGDWAHDPGDQAILTYAHREKRVLITQDKDFGELVIVRGQSHEGIVRLVGFAGREQGDICAWILGRYASDLREGAIITVNPQRVRIRPG